MKHLLSYSLGALALIALLSFSSCKRTLTGPDETPIDSLKNLAAQSIDSASTYQARPAGQKITPKATFKNAGTKILTASPVRFEIYNKGTAALLYSDDTVISTIDPSASVQQSFNEWTVPVGTDSAEYILRAIAKLPSDQNRANDTVTITVGNNVLVISPEYKKDDYYLSFYYKTDSNDVRLDATKANHSAIVADANATIGGMFPAVVLIDSFFNTDGSFASPPDTTYLQQQTNKDIWTYGFLSKLAKKLSSEVTIDIPPRWTNFAALSKGAGAVYIADTAHVTTMYNGVQVDADFIDSVKIIGIDTNVFVGSTRIEKAVKVLHTVYVHATAFGGAAIILDGHLPMAFWFCDNPRGIVKQQIYQSNFTGSAASSVPPQNSVLLLEKAKLAP